jgi:hypothetical protein
MKMRGIEHQNTKITALRLLAPLRGRQSSQQSQLQLSWGIGVLAQRLLRAFT